MKKIEPQTIGESIRQARLDTSREIYDALINSGRPMSPRDRADNMYTQDQLAQASGIKQTNISRYERGDKIPTIATARRLAEAMGLNYKDLLPD